MFNMCKFHKTSNKILLYNFIFFTNFQECQFYKLHYMIKCIASGIGSKIILNIIYKTTPIIAQIKQM